MNKYDYNPNPKPNTDRRMFNQLRSGRYTYYHSQLSELSL